MTARFVVHVDNVGATSTATLYKGSQDGGDPLQTRELHVLTTADGRPFGVWPVPQASGVNATLEDGTPLPDPTQLFDLSRARDLTQSELVLYGRVLFEAALGVDGLATIDGLVDASDEVVELAISTGATVQGLHDVRWELLHDGNGFMSLHSGPRLAVLRVMSGPAGLDAPVLLESDPKVLFAIGAALSDDRIRAGAEFMGVMRRLESQGGTIHPKVLVDASRERLTDALSAFGPNIVHVIAHGGVDAIRQTTYVELRADPLSRGESERVLAADLATILTSPTPPTVVILSACDGARSGIEGMPSMAATLIDNGVPIVVAMAGEVADKACRLFSRGVAAAIAGARSLSDAVAIGRSVAHSDSTGVASIDWALPTVFFADRVTAGFRLVNAPPRVMGQRLADLDLARRPVFCGRQEFLDAFDRVLDRSETLRAVGAILTGPAEGVGSVRLLRELGGRALRNGDVPVLLHYADSDDKRPRDEATFATAVGDAIANIRLAFNTLSPAPPAVPGGSTVLGVVSELRRLAEDLAGVPPFSDAPRPVLLLSRIHGWVDACDFVLSSIVTSQFTTHVPVVFSGAASVESGYRVRQLWENHRSDQGVPWMELLPLERWRADEERVAYQWLLLNPIKVDNVLPPVYTVAPGAKSAWVGSCSGRMENRGMFDRTLYAWANDTGVAAGWFNANEDEDALQSFPELTQ